MVRRSCTVLLLVVVLASCRKASGNDDGIVFWTPSAPPTQTPRIVEITTTALSTYTPIVKVVTETPEPGYLCVTADEAVHLRPSPSIENYPIDVLKNGTKLLDLGGRDGEWRFVRFDKQTGWVNQAYVTACE